jgi:type IV pilus assembly protein PilX
MLSRRNRQQGVVLMVALIVLVAMTLAGIALMRSVDTTALIAGNLAFQQSATNSADIGTETAVNWLVANNTGTTLHASIIGQGYVAKREDPAAGQSWDAFWTTVLDPSAGTSQVQKLAQDPVTGNTVAYVIHRMCNLELDPTAPTVDCAQAQTSSAMGGSSKGAGVVALLYNSSIYYRITTRVAGPRNTVSYVQTIVTL